jgi:hypothetical protein
MPSVGGIALPALPRLRAGDDAVEALWVALPGTPRALIEAAERAAAAGGAGSGSARATRIVPLEALEAEGTLVAATREVLTLAVEALRARGGRVEGF